MKKLISLLFLLITSMSVSMGQCAMCRATVENNLSNGDIGIGAGLNFGILYLFVAPYLAIRLIGFLWYRQSKKDQKDEQDKRNFRWKMPKMSKG